MLAMPDDATGFWVILWIGSIIAAASAGGARGQGLAGLAYGFLLGPLGLIVAATLPPSAAWEVEQRLDIEAEVQRRKRVAAEDALQEANRRERDARPTLIDPAVDRARRFPPPAQPHAE